MSTVRIGKRFWLHLRLDRPGFYGRYAGRVSHYCGFDWYNGFAVSCDKFSITFESVFPNPMAERNARKFYANG